MEKYKFHLDESGTPTPKTAANHPKFFILSGLIVGKQKSKDIKIKADRIKYKYWGDSFGGVVFHSREIGMRIGKFNILRNPDTETEFHKDLFSFLYSCPIKCITVSIDNEQASRRGWSGTDIYNNAVKPLLEALITFLITKKATTEIVVESAGTRSDFLLYKKYSYYLANGFPALGVDHSKIKKNLTSISFASKDNDDIETQIADLLSYPVRLKRNLSFSPVPNSYDDKICKILDYKTIQINGSSSFITIL